MTEQKTSFFPSWKENRGGWVCFGLLIVLSLFGHIVHEPWYDEAQAWQIAKTASWYDILFRIPHFEGHPPFWHLLLALPAKAGISWQIVYPVIGMICTGISGFLIIFKAPFPRWVRFLLPFTYFLFIQYGIIVRPYGIMVLLMILLAMAFPSKDEHPGRFVGLLAALCACHLFGICIAGGITIAWLLEIKNGHTRAEFLRGLWSDKRFHRMLGLLVWAVLLMAITFPAADTAADQPYKSSVLLNMLYVLFILPADSVLTNYHNTFFIWKMAHSIPDFILCFTVGLFIWFILLSFSLRKNWKYLLCPYVLLSVIFIFYCSKHHIGLFFLLVVWWAWIILQDASFKAPVRHRLVCQVAKFLLLMSLLIPLGWSVTQLYFDTTLTLFNGRQAIQFMQEHNRLNKRIFARWKQRTRREKIIHRNLHDMGSLVQLNLYYPSNFTANFHHGGEGTYNSFAALEGEDEETTFSLWRQGGMPDVLLGEVELKNIWPEKDLRSEYVGIYDVSIYDLWKFEGPAPSFISVYVRKDLAQELNLQPVEVHGYRWTEEDDDEQERKLSFLDLLRFN